MILQVTDEWIQVALRVTEEDGPGKGDRNLLKILLTSRVMLKPIDKLRRNQSKEMREEEKK